jgi:Protein of unknown function (DUF1566)
VKRRRILVLFAALLALPLAGPTSAKPPLWDKLVSGKKRFQVLKAFAGEAVLDKETGLVWARTPPAAPGSWWVQEDACRLEAVGSRFGFRLPHVEELLSLVEDGPPGTVHLPADHPFVGVAGGVFWSSSRSSFTAALSSDQVLLLDLGAASVTTAARNGSARAWCVRGGAGTEEVPIP